MVRNSHGFSISAVLLIMGLSVGSVTYIITNTLPKLDSERHKAAKTSSYQIFMSSLSEYLIHALRDRWCLDVNDRGETTLLQSANECITNSPMERVVTYRGNLERLLWDASTIGANDTHPKNTILAVNKLRRDSNKTSIILSKEDVEVTNNEMKFTVTRTTLNNMTENHPIYDMAQGVKNCLDEVSITLSIVKDVNSQPIGEEKKISLRIKPKVSLLNSITPACRIIKNAESTTFYTFYPRRLHTFSLLKYGNLDTSLPNEFNGPVYVAGHAVLPSANANPARTSIFKNKLILGVYNGGTAAGQPWPGKIVESDGSTVHRDFLLAHTVHSKHNSYSGFRGFLGGVSYDSVEDKGFYNLFDQSNQSTQSQDKLQLCILETKFLTDKSMNSSSEFGYKFSKNLLKTSFRLGFSLRNRFAPLEEIVPPKDNLNDDTPLAFEVNEGGRPTGEMTVGYESRDYSDPKKENETKTKAFFSKISSGSSTSDGTNFKLKINHLYFQKQLAEALKALSEGSGEIFPNSKHPLNSIAEYKTFKDDYLTFQNDSVSFESISADYKEAQKNACTAPPEDGTVDGGATDGGATDGGATDSGTTDGGTTDGGTTDSGATDGGTSGGKKDSGKGGGSKNNKNCIKQDEIDKLEGRYNSSKDALDKSQEALNKSLKALKDKLEDFQTVFNNLGAKSAEMIITLKDLTRTLNTNEKNLYKYDTYGKALILNQKEMIVEHTQPWMDLIKHPFHNLTSILKDYINFEVGPIQLNLKFFDLSANERTLVLRLKDDLENFSHVNSLANGSLSTPKADWARTTNNELLVQTKENEKITEVFELDCPEGMSPPDWDLDLSPSSNFSWNFANTQPGVDIQKEVNSNAPYLDFKAPNPASADPLVGNPSSSSKSVVNRCTIESTRNSVFGFYVCKELFIQYSETPLTITGTFIVKDIQYEGGGRRKIFWNSIWDPSSPQRILNEFYKNNSICRALTNRSISVLDVRRSNQTLADLKGCSPLNLILNGANNFSWTSVDPEIGLATPSDVMTTQKINRTSKFYIREETKKEFIR